MMCPKCMHVEEVAKFYHADDAADLMVRSALGAAEEWDGVQNADLLRLLADALGVGLRELCDEGIASADFDDQSRDCREP